MPNCDCDVIVIGGGPAGLSVALNSASEGLSTMMLDAGIQFGGQAATSTLIENYLGFAEGVTGPELAQHAISQCLKFKVKMVAPFRVDSVTRQEDKTFLVCSDGEAFTARAVVVTCGVQYRRLRVENLAAYLNLGLHYGSPSVSDRYQSEEVFVVGGANSAGQAACHLSECKDCMVHILVRGDSLEAKMSNYLIERLKSSVT